MKTRILYSGVFLNTAESRVQGFYPHSTWEFGDQAVLPVPEGTPVKIVVVGTYNDNDIRADIVEWHLADGSVLTHQPNTGNLLHITRAIKTPGTKAVESGIRATLYPEKIQRCEPYELLGTAGYQVAPVKEARIGIKL